MLYNLHFAIINFNSMPLSHARAGPLYVAIGAGFNLKSAADTKIHMLCSSAES
jgi:hypothetical protein